MWLADFAAPALPDADGPALRKLALGVLAGRSLAGFLARLDVSPADYARPVLGQRIPSAAALGCAAGDVDATLEMLGVIFSAAEANVAGQARRYAQACRRAEPDARTLVKVVKGILAHIETVDPYRASLPWSRMPGWVPDDALNLPKRTLRLDRVTRYDTGPFFFDRAVFDLSLFLHCCEANVSIQLVLTPHCNYPSVFRALRSIALTPPRISFVYSVHPTGASLPPPYIGLHRPLRQPSTEASTAAWATVWDALKRYAVGESRGEDVRAAIASAAAAKEPSDCSVASPRWLEWLSMNENTWTAIAIENYELLPGPVALFRQKSRLQ